METKIYMKTVKGGACFGAGFEGLGFCSHLLVSLFPEFLQQKAVKFCFCYIRLPCRGISLPFSCHVSSWIFVLQQLAPISLTWRAVQCFAVQNPWTAGGLLLAFRQALGSCGGLCLCPFLLHADDNQLTWEGGRRDLLGTVLEIWVRFCCRGWGGGRRVVCGVKTCF